MFEIRNDPRKENRNFIRCFILFEFNFPSKTNSAKSPKKIFDPLRKGKKESLERIELGCKACDIMKMTSHYS